MSFRLIKMHFDCSFGLFIDPFLSLSITQGNWKDHFPFFKSGFNVLSFLFLPILSSTYSTTFLCCLNAFFFG